MMTVAHESGGSVASQRGAPAKVRLDRVTMRFPSKEPGGGVALEDVSLSVPQDTFVSLVGRSGCGKTTMLNLVAGILRPTTGAVTVDGREVREPGPDRGIVFQHAALFPWMSAAANIEFGMRNLGISRQESRDRAAELIDMVGLAGFGSKFPHELSGGMRQRVAIARMLAIDPDVLLMDEPFGALDELTRADLQEELLWIWQQRRKTVVFITHSIEEAVYLSDVVHVVAEHRIRSSHEITLPRPRRRADPAFTALVEEVHGAIG
jgi:ABC-type nitrate/sulfonate/bicarbonate transport system ATPase subunit